MLQPKIDLPDDQLFSRAPESANAAFIHEAVDATNFLHVYGEIDLSNAHELEKAIGHPHSANKLLIVDLESCAYIDSRGLSVLVRAKKQLRHNFKVQVLAGSNIERLLRINSLREFLN